MARSASCTVGLPLEKFDVADRIDFAGIDHVQLAMPVGQEGKARRFYGELLGLVEVDKPPRLSARGGCWFVDRAGAIHIHLGVDPDFRPATKAHPAFVVRDLEPLRRRLEPAGGEVVEDDAIAGVRRFYAADPFGNRLEFVAESDRGFTAPDRDRRPAR